MENDIKVIFEIYLYYFTLAQANRLGLASFGYFIGHVFSLKY